MKSAKMLRMIDPAPDTPDRDHYTTIEVARMLGLAVRSVQLMVDRGELSAWKTAGGHRRISRAAVEQWRSGQNVTARAAPQPQSGEPALAANAARPTAAASVRKVLLIEDSVHFQNLVSLVVSQKFPQVQLSVANDGLAGLAMYGKVEPDVLIVDILLPGIDGATLITTLRSHPQFARSQLLVITSLDAAQREPYAFALQGVTVIHKPQLVSALPQALEQVLRQAQGVSAAP
jgi:excisionase family DNA binding protein